MTDDLDTLRPEVRAAMIRLESYLHITIGGKHFRSEDYDTIRAELLRLANENVGLRDNRLLLEREVENLHRELEAMESKRD